MESERAREFRRALEIFRKMPNFQMWPNGDLKENEDKTMKHNVTITKEENQVIEEYWVMRAIKEDVIVKGTAKRVFEEWELDHKPTLQETAQFLSETQADFVSVEHNYRFL